MRIRITAVYIIAFLAFSMVFSQLHEMAHISIGRWVCGQWGTQIDFNIWILVPDCFESNPSAVFASLAGPIFTYIMIGFGCLMLRSPQHQLWGFTMIMGNKPFARLFTVAVGGGDENTALRLLFADNWYPWAIKVLAFVIVFALTFPVLWWVYKMLTNKYKFWIVLGFSFLPLVFLMLYQFKLLKFILDSGFFAEIHFMGIPDLIHWHTLLMIIVFMISAYWVKDFGRKSPSN